MDYLSLTDCLILLLRRATLWCGAEPEADYTPRSLMAEAVLTPEVSLLQPDRQTVMFSARVERLSLSRYGNSKEHSKETARWRHTIKMRLI